MSARTDSQDYSQGDRRWIFGTAVLDERTLELHVKGEPRELERKSLQVLLHLLHHAGEVVTKDELLAAVWPGRILSDSALTSCVARVRDALQDDAQDVIKTVHGFGYRLIAPVKVETSPRTGAARFEFKPGEHLPARPLWSLVERLGAGAHGEAWLARHDKTHEKRVYKFAADGDALVTLKREITIYRLLHDTLGDRPDIVHLLDWNLDDPPYFVEYTYVVAGSLAAWANALGGIDRVPIEVRVDIAAQIADAVGAAHSVGVLHKDLKPSNVLMDARAGQPPQIKLCDFGSGGVLDVGRLEAMGITRLGFTKTLTSFMVAGGTPLYLAPEVIAGQPFTVRSDVYALGVILYQLIVGNFHKVPAPGWEQDVTDEMLREDIAAAAEGHPEQRLADASRLAARLRSLEARRRKRAGERAAKIAAEARQLELERMKARRIWLRVSVVTLALGFGASSTLYVDARRARATAVEAAAVSEAVSAFLGQDLFSQIGSEERPLRDLTVKELLDAGAERVDRRFESKPEAAARVRVALGQSYAAMDDVAAAESNLDHALALLGDVGATGSEIALEAAAKLVGIKNAVGKLDEYLPRCREIADAGRLALGPAHPKVLRLLQQMALGEHYRARWQTAVDSLRSLIVTASEARPRDERFIGGSEIIMGRSLLLLGDYPAAESVVRGAVMRLTPVLDLSHLQIVQARTLLGEALLEQGRYAEADEEFAAAEEAGRKWAPRETAAYVQRIRIARARLAMEQGHLSEATRALEQMLRIRLAHQGPEADRSFIIRRPLAEAYVRQNDLARAATQMELAVRSADTSEGSADPTTARMRIALADVYRRQGRRDSALAQLEAIGADVWGRLPPEHPMLAERRRVEGLLALAAGQHAAARTALDEAYAICRRRHGDQHWRTQEALRDLSQVSSYASRKG